jgi:uncharacterized membrane protein
VQSQTKRWIGVTVFTLLYPAVAYIVTYIPNPMVPGAIVALNMIFPILAGHFYGPISGAVAGSLGTALAALLRSSQFDALSVFPHTLMGFIAGWIGPLRSELSSASTILIGHVLNILFYIRLGLLMVPADQVGVTLLGIISEAMIDIVAIVLVIFLGKRWLYTAERW